MCSSVEIVLRNLLISWAEFQDNLINGEREILGRMENLMKTVLPLPSQKCDLDPGVSSP